MIIPHYLDAGQALGRYAIDFFYNVPEDLVMRNDRKHFTAFLHNGTVQLEAIDYCVLAAQFDEGQVLAAVFKVVNSLSTCYEN